MLSFNRGADYRNNFSLMDDVEWFGRVDMTYKGEQNRYALQAKKTKKTLTHCGMRAIPFRNAVNQRSDLVDCGKLTSLSAIFY